MTTTNLVSKPEAQAVAEIAQRAVTPSPFRVATPGPTADGGTDIGLIAVPQGVNLVSAKKYLDEYLDAPERREGTAHLGDLDSFIAHAERFKDKDSVIFASPNPQHPSLISVLDYHRQGGDGAPRFGRHRGVYDFPLSEEWTRWTKAQHAPMQQRTFAEFIESNILNVADPETAGGGAKTFATALACEFASPARLMELSRGLSVRVNSKVANAINLSSGEGQLVYGNEHTDERGQPLKVPGAFLLALRVFRGGAVYQVPARLRYRVKEGEVTWSFELWRTDRVFEDAFLEARDKVAAATGLPVFVGTPEA